MAIQLYRSRDKKHHPDGEVATAFRAQRSPHVCVSPEDRAWRKANRPDLAAAPDLQITYMGIWDTVGARGVPGYLPGAGGINDRFNFHDTKLSAMVQAGRHAMALDERRGNFPPCEWDPAKLGELNAAAKAAGRTNPPYLQHWFPGGHGSVGGGGDITLLSDAALSWVAKGAEEAGLTLANGFHERLEIDHRGPLENRRHPKRGMADVGPETDRRGPSIFDDVGEPTRRRYRDIEDYRPGSLTKVTTFFKDWIDKNPPD